MLCRSCLAPVLNLCKGKAPLCIVELVVDHPALLLDGVEEEARRARSHLLVGLRRAEATGNDRIESIDGCVLGRGEAALHAQCPGKPALRLKLLQERRGLVMGLLMLILLLLAACCIPLRFLPLALLGPLLLLRRSPIRWRSGAGLLWLAAGVELDAVCLDLFLGRALLDLDIHQASNAHGSLNVSTCRLDRGLEVAVRPVGVLVLEATTVGAPLQLDLDVRLAVGRGVLLDEWGLHRGGGVGRVLRVLLRLLLLFRGLLYLHLGLFQRRLLGCIALKVHAGLPALQVQAGLPLQLQGVRL
mmetsp:Transcript_14081/g.38728  ORF Transcript_14081/g.38728 Transcript_14081/m.38728 type:complete len:301 (-) Transcript_14081:1067-1969(-)